MPCCRFDRHYGLPSPDARDCRVKFRVEHRGVGVGSGQRDEGEEARAVDDVHVLSFRHLMDDRIVGAPAGEEPELADGRLLSLAFGAVARAQLADLVDIARPDLRIECGWRFSFALGCELGPWPANQHHPLATARLHERKLPQSAYYPALSRASRGLPERV
jgi:hypothetical protein